MDWCCQLRVDLSERKKDSEYIKKMNDILLDGAEEDDNSKKFISSLTNDLQETLASLQSKGTANGRSILKGYKENYFNEIIQNIEDLNKSGREKDQSVTISIHGNDNTYVIECEYQDRGFSSSDLYGFCNVAKGAKKEEDLGMYGIGIKAIFSASSEIEVESNVVIKYTTEIGDTGDDERRISINLNKNWGNAEKVTRMKFVILKECDWINTKKMGNVHKESKVFLSDKPEEVLFDYRALLFTRRIKSIKINDWELGVEPEFEEKKSSESEPFLSVWTLTLKKGGEQICESKYLVYANHSDKQIKNMAFCFYNNGNENSEPENRIYCTFFLKNYAYREHNLKKMGILVNVDKKYTNSCRSDVSDNEQEINAVHKAIYEKLEEVFKWFTEEDISKKQKPIREAVSRVFHSSLMAYKDDILTARIDTKDFGIFEKVETGNKFLPKLKLNFTENKTEACSHKYVVFEDECEAYSCYDNMVEDEKAGENKAEVYHRVFEAGEVITFKRVMNENDVLAETISTLYKHAKTPHCSNNAQPTENGIKIFRGLLNYYESVAEFIRFRVQNWQEFLAKVEKQEDKANIRKLLGAYKILKFLDENGCLDKEKLTILDYLFLEKRTDAKEDDLEKEIFSVYDDKYGDLKRAMMKGIGELSIIKPTSCSLRGFQGECGYELKVNPIDLSENMELLFRLLVLIDDQDLYAHLWKTESTTNDFVLIHNGEMAENVRDARKGKSFTHSESQKCKVVQLELEGCKCRIGESLKYQKILDKVSKYYLFFKVSEEKTDMKNLISLVQELVERKHESKKEFPVELKSIDTNNFSNQCNKDYADFVRQVTGNDIQEVVLAPLEVRGNRKVTVFIYNRGDWKQGIKIKTSSGGKFEFWNLWGTTVLSGKNERVFVFYANQGKEEALADALNALGLGEDVEEQIEGYVTRSAIGRSVSSREYEIALKHNNEKTKPTLCDGKILPSELSTNLSVRSKIKLLLARGSYNGRCPICDKSLMGEDKDDLNKAASMAKIFTVNLQSENETSRFFQSCCCADCLELLRKTAVEIVMENKELCFTKIINSGQNGKYKEKKVVQLSNVNQIIGFLNKRF